MTHRSLTAVLASAFLICGLPFAGAGDLEAEVARMARVGACWSPSFSPDGSQLAFVSNINGAPQVWSVDAAGGWPRLVTTLDDPVGGVSWSPDGEWLAFSLAPGGGMNQQIYLTRPNGMEVRRLTPGGTEGNWLGSWSRDGAKLALASNRENPASMDAYLFDVRSGETTLAAKNPGIGGITDLAADGTTAVLFRMESRSSDNLFLRNLETGEEQLLTEHEGPGSFDGGVFSPDGSIIYLSSNLSSDRTVFARIKISSDGTAGAIQDIATRTDAELGSFAVADDGSLAALLWNAGGKSLLEFVDLATLEHNPGPELPAEIAGGLDFSADGRYLAMTLSGAAAPPDIWILDIRTSELRQVTHSPHAGVDLEDLVRPELVTYPAHDGLGLSGWLYRPSGIEGPTPFVLSFHGGPEGQERPRFRSDYQALLGRGIGILAPNVRGSWGFGKAFVNLDNGPLRYNGIKDIKATVDFLVSEGIADPKRLGIMGGSYGGYMTMAGLAWYPELFAAGANLFGVVNFETFFAQTEPWMAAISTIEYGDPETEVELLRDLSPIHKVDRVRAPTIVLHGANDTNVPVVEAEQVVESLKKRNVPVEYVLFPDEGHGFRKTTNRITSTTAIVKWFERYLKVPASGPQGAWPQFRGPSGMPVGDHPGLPASWSTAENVEWVTEIPGLGWSSPVVWGNKVFVTSTTSDKAMKQPSLGVDFSNDYFAELMKQGKTEEEVIKALTARDSELPRELTPAYHLYCVDLESGRVLWTNNFHEGPPPVGRHRKNSYASETPVTDGQAVYVYVAFLGLYAFDFEGRQLWHTPLEAHQVYLDFGGGASPALHGDRLLILNDNEEDIKAGKESEFLGISSLEEFAMATPAIEGGRLLVRTQSKLYSLRGGVDAGS
jgi:dipeptidyl aminopeptidase/acylaminoacyl peptidase